MSATLPIPVARQKRVTRLDGRDRMDTNLTLLNATVWQNYSGVVVNLGWGAKSAGDGSLIDGLYVVKDGLD